MAHFYPSSSGISDRLIGLHCTAVQLTNVPKVPESLLRIVSSRNANVALFFSLYKAREHAILISLFRRAPLDYDRAILHREKKRQVENIPL